MRNFHPFMLKSIESAAANGDPVAKWVNEEIKKEDSISGQQDNFRIIQYQEPDKSWDIAYSSHNTKNKEMAKLLQDDPDLPYKKGRFNVCSPSKFLTMFKNHRELNATDKMLEDFAEALKVGSRLTCKISEEYPDFQMAYLGYGYGQVRHESEHDTINKSCMKYGSFDKAEDDPHKRSMNFMVSEFYKYICRCRIMIILNELQQVVGRALIWPNVVMESGFMHDKNFRKQTISALGRQYYTCVGVRDFMRREAKKLGIGLNIVKVTSYNCEVKPLNRDISNLANVRFFSRLYPDCRYNGKVPYIDFFHYVWLRDGELWLSNKDNDNRVIGQCIADCQDLEGGMITSFDICPYCGNTILDSSNWLCKPCEKALGCKSIFARYPVLKTTDAGGYKDIPEVFVKDGKVTKNAELAILFNRMQGINLPEEKEY